MRKLIVVTTLTVVLAGSASAANSVRERGNPRDGETAIVRFMKIVKRLLTPSVNTTPTTPIP